MASREIRSRTLASRLRVGGGQIEAIESSLRFAMDGDFMSVNRTTSSPVEVLISMQTDHDADRAIIVSMTGRGFDQMDSNL